MENNTAFNNKIEYELDAETRAKMARKKEGVHNPNYGRPRDEETKRKISQSQSKRWAKINAFNEATELCAVKQVWPKRRYFGAFCCKLNRCHHRGAIYYVYNINTWELMDETWVDYYEGNIWASQEFPCMDDALTFYNNLSDGDYDLITNETPKAKTKLGSR